ncbi:MAG TPA: acetylesterase [Clostridiaceae bacterium]|nr:acetylesterase [Clostridiaceae bacterium]
MDVIRKRIKELKSYSPSLTSRDDLDSFWEKTLKECKNKPLNAVKEKADTFLLNVDVYKITYYGYDETPLYGWYLVPNFLKGGKLPCAVIFHGYTGSKGYPEEYARWLLMGMAVFAIDIRGQGGETGNLMGSRFGMVKGWITQGILDKDTCYYKAITVDCLRALDWVSEQPEIDKSRICVMGGSQGGGLTFITAALSDKPAIAAPCIPNMCHMDLGVFNSTSSLTEIAEFVSRFPGKLDKVLETLSYFDIMNLADRISIPVLVSVGLKDTICMPETIFAAYNNIKSEKHIKVYPFMGHCVPEYHRREIMSFINNHFKK